MVVTIKRLITWWHIPGTAELEREAAANGLLNDHLRIHKQGRETRKARGTILALCLAGLAAAAVAMVVFAPWWAWALAAAVAVRAVRPGRAPGRARPSRRRAELPAQVQPPDQDVITRALGSLGIAEISQAIAERQLPRRTSRRRSARTGPAGGPRSTCRTASPPRRSSSAGSSSRPGLRRPLGAVWPELVTHEHAGRLECWVGRADISKAKPRAVAVAADGRR